MKIALLGAGNIAMALAKGLLKAKLYEGKNILLTRKSNKFSEQEVNHFTVGLSNSDAVKQADVLVLGVLPQQLNGLLDEIKSELDADKHLLVSMVTGVSTQDIINYVGKAVHVVRAMPNTAMAIGQSMTTIASANASDEEKQLVKKMFDQVGTARIISEDLMTSATALNACGIAFFLRAIRAASQGGTEIGFHAHEALEMAAQTALGAAALLRENGNHPEREIDNVTSPSGCTIAGLNEMEHNGFSSAMIKGIKLSMEKAGGLYNNEK